MLLFDLSNIINFQHVINLKTNKNFTKVSYSSKEVNKQTIFVIDNKKKIKNEYLIEALNKKIPAIISSKIYSNLSHRILCPANTYFFKKILVVI